MADMQEAFLRTLSHIDQMQSSQVSRSLCSCHLIGLNLYDLNLAATSYNAVPANVQYATYNPASSCQGRV